MAKASSWIRPGLHTVTPRLVFKNATDAIEFYKVAFGAKERVVSMTPDGRKVLHGELQIGDSVLYVVDEVPDQGCVSPQSLGAGMSLALSVQDADSVFKTAVDAGCTVKRPLMDAFWGDRWGCVLDPFGNTWEIATHVEDLTESEIQERAKKAFAQMAGTKS